MVGEIYKTNRIKCSDGYPGGILHICNLSDHKGGFYMSLLVYWNMSMRCLILR